MHIISKLKEDSNSGEHKPKKRKIYHVSSSLNQNLDIICKRFPRVSQRILKNLDDQSLERSNEVSQGIAQVLNNERFFWIRMIKTYVYKFQVDEQSWNEVITKTPVKIIKQFALAVKKYFKHHSFHKTSPLQIVAEYGNGQLCQHVLRKTKNKNPQLNCEIVRDIHHIKDSVVWKFSTTKNEKESAISSKNTLFHVAAMNGLVEICRFLLDIIDDGNLKCNNGFTPLFLLLQMAILKCAK